MNSHNHRPFGSLIVPTIGVSLAVYFGTAILCTVWRVIASFP